jgi:hypothetical protein
MESGPPGRVRGYGGGSVRLHFHQRHEIGGGASQLRGLIRGRSRPVLHVPAHDGDVVAAGAAPRQRDPLGPEQAAADDDGNGKRRRERPGPAPQGQGRENHDRGDEEKRLEDHEHRRKSGPRRQDRRDGRPHRQEPGNDRQKVVRGWKAP